jgi:plastocyanin
MRALRLFARSSSLLVLPILACATFAACSGDDSTGTSTDAGGTPDGSQSDTGTVDGSPLSDAAHDSAATDSSSTDSSADSATTDGSGDDGGDGGDAAPSTVVPCPGGTTPTQTVTVGASGDSFSPTTVTINVGDTVQWTWSASFHSVTSVANTTTCTPDGTFCSPDDTNCSAGTLSNSGTTYCQKFTAAGTFNYVCFQHCAEGMRGSVVVQ